MGGRRGRSLEVLTSESPDLNFLHISRIRIYDLNNMVYDSTSIFAYINLVFFKFQSFRANDFIHS